MTMISRAINLAARPTQMVDKSHFQLVETQVLDLEDGQVRVKNLFMSVDPYMRGRMSDKESYIPPFQIGQPLEGGAVGIVTDSASPDFAVGDHVLHMLGWREIAQENGKFFQKIDITHVPAETYLGVLGMPGLTAWGGLMKIGKPKAGDTIFVSGAAGAVGSLVCQLAHIEGCKVVGSVGTDDKAAYLKRLGVDEVINYRTTPDLTAALKAAAPKGIDMYFDNVGGDHLEAALEAARNGARFVECGMISQYNSAPPAAPRNLIYVVGKSLKMEGFIVMQYMKDQPEFFAHMLPLLKAGKIDWRQTIVKGIEQAPEAFIGLFSGKNTGKMLVAL